MNLIVQPKKSRLCGQCCLAMISGKELPEIIKIVGHKHGTKTKELVKVFKKLKIKCDKKLRVLKKNQTIPTICILKVKYKNHSSWHWVVFNSGKIYDPAIGAIKIGKYLELYPNGTKISSYLEIFDKIA